MCGFDPRISEWSSADATCPLAYASSNRTPTTLTDVGLTGHFISGDTAPVRTARRSINDAKKTEA
jgi:hypothetical protein